MALSMTALSQIASELEVVWGAVTAFTQSLLPAPTTATLSTSNEMNAMKFARTTREARLPQELERVIFEMAARDQRRIIPALMQVAHRVYDWLEAILYEIVVIVDDGSPCQDPDAQFCCRVPHPSGQRTRHVRYLLLSAGSIRTRLPEFRQHEYCNLQNLTLWGEVTPTIFSDLSSIVDSSHRTVSPRGLLRLETHLVDLFPARKVDFNHGIMKDLTYLDIADMARELSNWPKGNNFGCLKNLKCLCITWPVPVDFIQRCLEECQALQVLILFDNNFSRLRRIEDQLPKTRKQANADGDVEELPEDRIVLLGPNILDACQGWREDWVLGAMGGEDFLVKAEVMVQERRRTQAIA